MPMDVSTVTTPDALSEHRRLPPGCGGVKRSPFPRPSGPVGGGAFSASGVDRRGLRRSRPSTTWTNTPLASSRGHPLNLPRPFEAAFSTGWSFHDPICRHEPMHPSCLFCLRRRSSAAHPRVDRSAQGRRGRRGEKIQNPTRTGGRGLCGEPLPGTGDFPLPPRRAAGSHGDVGF